MGAEQMTKNGTMKKKLLFINGHLNTGGTEKALVDILCHMDYEKYDVDLLLVEGFGDYAALLPPQLRVIYRDFQRAYGPFAACLVDCVRSRDWFSLKMRLISVLAGRMGQGLLKYAAKLLLGEHHYDCVIAFRPGFSSQLSAFAVRADRRISWWHHGEVVPSLRSFPDSALFCDSVAVVSDSCRVMLAREFPELADKLVTIPNMLDAGQILERAGAYDPYSDKSVRHIVSVGRLSEEKHFENAIRAARALKERGIRFIWHLVGDGPLRGALEQLARELDITDCFIFEGNQPNPYPWFRHADLFVHPSYVESFGIVVLEAMALGIPCVVARSLGPEEFIEDGINGLLTGQSPEALTDGVLRILEDRALYDSIRANSRCPEQYLPEIVMKRIEELFFAGENTAEQKR